MQLKSEVTEMRYRYRAQPLILELNFLYQTLPWRYRAAWQSKAFLLCMATAALTGVAMLVIVIVLCPLIFSVLLVLIFFANFSESSHCSLHIYKRIKRLNSRNEAPKFVKRKNKKMCSYVETQHKKTSN